MEQAWHLKSISTGIMNMVIRSARQQEGRHADVTLRGPKANEVCPSARLQFHLAPEIIAQAYCISNISPSSLRGVSARKKTR